MRISFAMLAAALVVLCTRNAAAQVDCLTDLPNPLFVQSGDTQRPLLKELGRKLRDNTSNPITLVFILTPTCTLADAIYNDTPITTTPFYIPSSLEDPGWTTMDPEESCNLPVGGVPIDVAIGATFIESCNLGNPPPGIGLITGPIQAYTFAVPEDSGQEAITAEEGYFAFGFGSAGLVDPWLDDMQYFIRGTATSTLLTTMAGVGVPVSKAKGVAQASSTAVVTALQNAVDADIAIGLLGAEIYDRNRDTLNALAFRAFGQRHAYFPDSTRNATDKQNVRDAHYTVWSPTVYITHVNGQGVPTDQNARYLIDLVLGKSVTPTPSPAWDSLATVIGRGLVPDCAMKVKRPLEGADLEVYDPDEPCHCFFEDTVGALSESCVECDDNGPCNGGVCRHGFCEAH